MIRVFTIFLIVLVSACRNTEPVSPMVEPPQVESKTVQEEVISPYAKYDFEMLMGRFVPADHEDYVLIDEKYADRTGMYLHKDSYSAFIKMYDAALADGIKFQIRSATRNFDYQKGIWERKWNGETKVGGEDISKTIADPKTRALRILEYSSMPGTSRHHWGTDIDLNSFDNKWFETGEGKILLEWLETNASQYGFCRPYTAKDEKRPDGYFEERWHWSYMPLAKYFSDLAKKQHNNSKIVGFQGAEVASEINVVEKYVFGINEECL